MVKSHDQRSKSSVVRAQYRSVEGRIPLMDSAVPHDIG